jgi:hypothetical protein
LYLLSLMGVSTSALTMSIYMFVLGFGLGMVMQVLVIAVQNAVEFRHLGTATSGATFFRSIGSAFGVSIFGEIFARTLNTNLATLMSSSSLPQGFNPQAAMSNPQLLQSLPLSVIGSYLQGFAVAIHTVFLYAIPVALIGFVFSWFLKEYPLRMTTHIGNAEGPEAMPAMDGEALKCRQQSIGWLMAALAIQAQRKDADPVLLANLSASVDGSVSHDISDERRGRLVAQVILQPLALKLIEASLPQPVVREERSENPAAMADKAAGAASLQPAGCE